MSKKKKKKTETNVPPIPPLSPKALDGVQEIERYAHREVRDCHSSSHFNTQKAERILRTCAVQVLRIQLDYYESLPSFHCKWVIELQRNTIESAVGMVPGGYGADLHEYFRNILWDTTYADLNPPTLKPKPAPKVANRKALRDAYLGQLPGVKILDICWAAKQRYREWKRWLKRELKDDSTPDRAFREVLTSGKRPAELRDAPRPSGWK